MRRFRIFSIPLFAFLLAPAAGSAELRYNGYSNHVVGTRRIIGLGGAYTAIADGISCAWTNPAGLSAIEESWDWSAGYGATESSDRFLGGRYTLETHDVTYVYFGIVDRVESWRNFGYGIVVDSPSKQDATARLGDETLDYQLQHVALTVPLSVTLFENLHVGIALQVHSTNNQITFTSPTDFQKKVTDFTTASFMTGALYEMGDWRLGIAVTPEKTLLPAKNKKVETLNGHEVFRNTAIPLVFQIGAARRIRFLDKHVTVASDLRMISGLDDTILPASDFAADPAGIQVQKSMTFQYHLGGEYETPDGKWEFRIGHYIQPSRYPGGQLRIHGTGGIDYYFWYLNIGFAFDAAENFYNLSLSIFPSWKLANRGETNRRDRETSY